MTNAARDEVARVLFDLALLPDGDALVTYRTVAETTHETVIRASRRTRATGRWQIRERHTERVAG